MNRLRAPLSSVRLDATTPDGGAPGTDADFARVELLDRLGVDYALLMCHSAAMINVLTYAAEAVVLATAYNDYFLEQWAAKDPRWRLAMVVAPQDPRAAADEIRRRAGNPAIAAIWLPTINVLVGNVHYHPIFEAAQECGLPVTIHPIASYSQYQGGETFPGGIPSTYVEWGVGFPQLGMAYVSSIIFEGVLEKFPNLRFIFAEYGWAWLPHLMWRMDAWWTAMRPDVPWVRRQPSQYIVDSMRFTTQPFPEAPKREYLDRIIEMARGSETLMFSSDYPHWDADEPIEVVRDLAEPVRDRIMYRNAHDFFGSRLMPARQEVPTG